MAFAATTQWEVRQTGSDVYGGGFDPSLGGTDYSIFDTPIATGTASSVTTTLTATTGIFTAAMVGNLVTNGTIWAQIVGFTSATVVTLDSSPAWTSQAITVGGALASPGKAAALKVASNPVFIKNSGGATPTVYLMSNSANVAGGKVSDGTTGTDSAPNYWIGYETTRTTNNTDANHPILKANVNTVTCIAFSSSYGCIRNIDAGNNGAFTGVTGFNLGTGASMRVENAVVTGVNTGFTGSGQTYRFVGVVADTCTNGFLTIGGYLANFVAKNCTTTGVTMGAQGVAVCGVVSGTAGQGILVNGNNCVLANVTVYGSSGASGDGLKFTAGVHYAHLINVVSYGNAQKNFNITTTELIHRLQICASGGGGVADSIPTGSAIGLITLSGGDPFVASGSGDFRLNNLAGRGALLRAAGFPVAFLGYPSVANAADVGAYQHADPAGGGGGGGSCNF